MNVKDGITFQGQFSQNLSKPNNIQRTSKFIFVFQATFDGSFN